MFKRLIRSRRFWMAAVPLGVLGLYLAFAVFGIQALFYDVEVNEDFPTASGRAAPPMQLQSAPAKPTVAPTSMPMASAQPAATQESAGAAALAATAKPAPSATQRVPAPTATAAPTAIPTAVPTPEPVEPVLVRSGTFHDVFHVGTGDALIYRQPDGSYLLRLENLDVDNGPDLYVYAVAAPDTHSADEVLEAGFVSVAQLKGNKGNQNYVLPAEFDPTVHRSISIWCQRFSVNFATAPLQ